MEASPEHPVAWHEATLRPLEGGYSGETYVGGVGRERAVVRIYSRNPRRATIDASLLHLVRGLVPVPAVLELRHPTGSTPAVLVTEYVAGTRLDLALADPAGVLDLDVLGRSLGAILASLAGIPFLRAGEFVDGELALSPVPLPGDLRDWAERLRPAGRLSTWADRDWAALVELLDVAQDLVEESESRQPARAVLVHSDFNPKNILVDPTTSEVTAVLDWEFAHAGSVHSDLGNLTRFERDPRLIGPLAASLGWSPGREAGEHLRLARALDLWALVELAGRPQSGPVPELATELLRAQARSADLDAWPWQAPRVAPRPQSGG